MWYFQLSQFIKDSVAVLCFFLFANMPLLHTNNWLLCSFFIFGCVLDISFVFIRWYCNYILTVATIKDILGVIGMFSFIIIISNDYNIINWQHFFYLAFAIDYISVLSICSEFNIYKLPPI